MPTKLPPKMGWSCREVIDAKLDEASKKACDVCGTRIRWVHVVEHGDYHGSLEVGRCCVQRMCEGYDAEAAEREIRNRSSRRQRFLEQSAWKRSRQNEENIWRRVQIPDEGTVTITVYQTKGRFAVCFAGKGDDRFFDRVRSATRESAMNRAFHMVECLRGEPS